MYDITILKKKQDLNILNRQCLTSVTESVLADNWPIFPDKSESWLDTELLSSLESTPSSWRGVIMGERNTEHSV